MTPEERQQSLTNARLACDYLNEWVVRRSITNSVFELAVGLKLQEYIATLLAEFKRLDEAEQKRIADGKRTGKKGKKFGHLGAEFGKLGGRPRKTEK